MSRFLVSLLEELPGEQACQPSIRWAASLPEDTTPEQAWDVAPGSWRDWLALKLHVVCEWREVERALERFGLPVRWAPYRQTQAFFSTLRSEEPAFAIHPADAWTLAALGRAA